MKTSYVTRFSYAATDVAGQLVFCWIMWYAAYFYSDVCKIPAATVGTILLLARWVDAFDTPLWGLIFDKTRSRLGKYRPWFLWLSIPFATFGALTFLMPELSLPAKVAYAAITYIGCNVLYTGINTPVTSILSTLTADPHERVTLTTFRMFGSKLGVLIVNLTGLELVRLLGQGDERRGFMLAVPIYALVSAMLFWIAYRNLKEVVPVETKSQPFFTAFKALKGNWPWLIIFCSSLMFWIGFIARITVVPHYFKYSVHKPELTSIANALDFGSLGVAVLLPWLCTLTSKRNVWLAGLIGMLLGQIILWLAVINNHSLVLFMVGWLVGFLASGAAMAMPFSLLPNAVDYGEWKTGVRAAGLLAAIGAAFCLKAGAGIGGALPMWILGAAGFVADREQSPDALWAIESSVVWLPAIFIALSAIPVLFYKKFEQLEPQIRAELEQRRARTTNVHSI